jgi:hypothetical protein
MWRRDKARQVEEGNEEAQGKREQVRAGLRQERGREGGRVDRGRRWEVVEVGMWLEDLGWQR